MHAHLRPNLMSSARRGGHEDSILAKLEREPARRGGGGNGARLAWYGAAVVLAIGLTATLAWLAAGAGPAPLEMAHNDVPLSASAPPAPIATALIVDAAPEPVLAALPTAAPVPPLRLLEPAAARGEPARLAPKPARPAPPRRAEARIATPARQRAQAAQAAQATRNAPRQAPRPARTVNPARPGEAQDDSDVALISAVILHANGHATAGDGDVPATPCGGEPCRARPGN